MRGRACAAARDLCGSRASAMVVIRALLAAVTRSPSRKRVLSAPVFVCFGDSGRLETMVHTVG